MSHYRLNLFIQPEHAKRLDELAAKKGVSKSSIVAAALASWLSPDAADQREAAIAKRLDRLSRHAERMERDQNIAIETLALFIRYYLTVSTPVPEAHQDLRVNVLVKPIRSGLKTNLVITTSRRTYLLELTSTEKTWMASVSWEYPRDRMLALQRQAQAAGAAAPVDSGLSLENLRFRYDISGSNPPWKPLRAFDDGEKVYIQFPGGIAQGELPPLFVIGPEGDGQLVNYRFRSPYYIVDRLFGAAELRLGADKGDVVRIERTDGVARRN